jgi:hypothetical protein
MAGTKTDQILTAEPAVAVPAVTDANYRDFASGNERPQFVIAKAPSGESEARKLRRETFPSLRSQNFPTLRNQQNGAVMRRMHTVQVQDEAGVLLDEALPSEEDDTPALTPVRMSSLGRIREGANGEMYLIESKEADKDK